VTLNVGDYVSHWGRTEVWQIIGTGPNQVVVKNVDGQAHKSMRTMVWQVHNPALGTMVTKLDVVDTEGLTS
jgi:hypothetical protein